MPSTGLFRELRTSFTRPDLALEAHGILFNILLVSIRVVPIATVRIWHVAVRSDLAGGCAAEAMREQ
jgi:hypothetical protein